MRKLILTLLFTLLYFMGIAQVSVTFNDTLRPFGEGAYENRTVCADDSFYYIGGVFISYASGGVNHYYVYKVDKQGVVTDKRLYLDTLNVINNYPYNSMLLNRDQIITCFYTEDTSLIKRNFVMAINRNSLDSVWTRYYAHPDKAAIQIPSDNWSTLTAIKRTSDNNYILSGNYKIAGNYRGFIMKIDTLGNIIPPENRTVS